MPLVEVKVEVGMLLVCQFDITSSFAKLHRALDPDESLKMFALPQSPVGDLLLSLFN